MFEEHQDVAVPLSLQFQYCPSQGFAPIHKIASGHNEHIKQFYWKLWFGDDEVLPNIDIHENFVGPDVTINSNDVERFCAVAGNQGESFKVARNDNVQVLMDFAIVTCWKVISILFSHSLYLNYIRPSWNPSFQLPLMAIYLVNSSINPHLGHAVAGKNAFVTTRRRVFAALIDSERKLWIFPIFSGRHLACCSSSLEAMMMASLSSYLSSAGDQGLNAENKGSACQKRWWPFFWL